MFDVGEQIPSGARQMKLPLTLPPSEAHPPRQMRQAPASRRKLRMSSAPYVADFENLIAPRPTGQQRNRPTRPAGEQEHPNRQDRKSTRLTSSLYFAPLMPSSAFKKKKR